MKESEPIELPTLRVLPDTLDDKIRQLLLSPTHMLKIQKMLDMTELIFPDIELPVVMIIRSLATAFLENDAEYNIDEAIEYGNNFSFPTFVHENHAQQLIDLDYDLEKLVSKVQGVDILSRFNLQRVQLWDQSDPDIDRLYSLAQGMTIHPDPDFKPNGRIGIPKMRSKYRKVSTAVNRILYESYNSNLIIILPTWLIKTQPGIHYSLTGWAPKRGKRCGRVTIDPSNLGQNEGTPLNSKSMKLQAREIWGQICLPTLSNLACMILDMANKYGWDKIILWKKDLKGAFTLLNFHPSVCHLLANELTEGLVAIYTSGLFGLGEMPFMFNVISRALNRAFNIKLNGTTMIFVDDTQGVSQITELTEDMHKADTIIRSLTGPDSVAKQKDESGRVIEWIGWNFDLDGQSISISFRNFNKVLYGMFELDEHLPIKAKYMDKIASWASRYTEVCRFMSPFTQQLYHECVSIKKKDSSHLISPDTIFCIRLWRVVLLVMNLHPDSFKCRIHEFRVTIPDIIIEYDGSLIGIGFIISLRSEGSNTLLKYASIPFPFNLDQDSSYQNSAEFIALTMSFACLLGMGIRGKSVKLIGDSIASLTWASKDRFWSSRAQRAALLFVSLGQVSRNYTNDNEHIPGVQNIEPDMLSRLSIPPRLAQFPQRAFDISSHSIMTSFLQWCDPTRSFFNQTDGVTECDPDWVTILSLTKELSLSTQPHSI